MKQRRYTDLRRLVSVYTTVSSNSATWLGGGVGSNEGFDNALSLTSTKTIQNSAITTALNLLAPAPTYISPVGSMTNFPAPEQEVGTSISGGFLCSWSQNDAGNIVAGSGGVIKNGIKQLGTFSGLPVTIASTEVAVLGTTTHGFSASYIQGPLKNNVLNIPDSRGRINAGSFTVLQSYTGFYRYFYGSVAAVPTNLRTLPSNVLGTSNSIPSFTADQNNIVIVIPTTKVLQSVITQTLENITSNFVETAVTVNDAGGTGRSYRRYVATTVTPLNIPISITLA